jgi:CxxC motif-containing protein (DUF1111 family)
MLFLLTQTKTPASRRVFFLLRGLLISSLMVLLAPAAMAGKSGGDTSVYMTNRQAFSQPAANMPMLEKLDFSVGNSFFKNPWVAAPSSTTARDGLGPLFNTNGCQNCHIRDGRGHPPLPGQGHAVSMLLRLSIPADSVADKDKLVRDGAIPEPTYGGQLQDFAGAGLAPEGQIALSYRDVEIAFNDGTIVSLRKPEVSLSKLAYGPLHPDTMMSLRVAPAMIGLGLLAAIPEQALIANADPQDLDHDGISGSANQVWDIAAGKTVMGRFGWKAGQPSLRQQNASAFSGDMGLTTSLIGADDCTARQQPCINAVDGGQPEVSDNILRLVTFYTHNLAVPAQRDVSDAQVQRGQALFRQANCQACHRESFTTGESEFPWLAGQQISPYTDLLLHDMGEGLADHRPEFLASGSQWRTPPLWGIGLTQTVVGHGYFLHDGRARNLLEAILWHDSEARAARDAVLAMDKSQRQALIRFLESL